MKQGTRHRTLADTGGLHCFILNPMATERNKMDLATYRALAGGVKKHKYNAEATHRDGIRFDSKLEARHYDRLCMLRAGGDVSYFLRQVPLHLPGGVRLVVDFLVFYADGRVCYEDTKGRETATFKSKRRIAEAIYPITIDLIRS